jgi:hypothetical protein
MAIVAAAKNIRYFIVGTPFVRKEDGVDTDQGFTEAANRSMWGIRDRNFLFSRAIERKAAR